MAKANNRDRGLIQYPDGVWGVLCVLHGKRHQRKVGKKDDARFYYDWCQQQNRERAREDYVEPPPEVVLPTFGQAAGAFLRHREARGSESALPGYRCNAQLFTEMWGDLVVDQLTAGMVEGFVEGRLAGGVREATVNRQLAFLKGVYRLALDSLPEHARFRNPLERVKLLKENNQVENYLAPGDQDRLWAELAPWVQRLVGVAVLTGIRKGNLLRLERADVHVQRRALRLPKTKDGKHLWVQLSEEALELIEQQLASHPHQLVWPSSTGTQINPSNLYNRHWKPALERAGVKLRFHDLRHTTAQRLIEFAGFDLFTVQRLLGQKNPKTTQRYAHLSEAHLRRAVEALSSAGREAVQAARTELQENVGEQKTAFSQN